MTIEIITTSQAPDAKPVGFSTTLDSDWTTIIEVPSYNVPEESFGGTEVVVPGVAEIISPMFICNTINSTVTFDLRVFRAESNTHFTLAKNLPIFAEDVFIVPLNGQFIFTGDILEAKSNTSGVLDITISFTLGQAEQDDVV
jgi:hypothetical protein